MDDDADRLVVLDTPFAAVLLVEDVAVVEGEEEVDATAEEVLDAVGDAVEVDFVLEKLVVVLEAVEAGVVLLLVFEEEEAEEEV